MREAAMDAETVLTIEAEGMPVRMRCRPGYFEVNLAVSLWITSLHEVFLSRWCWRTLPP